MFDRFCLTTVDTHHYSNNASVTMHNVKTGNKIGYDQRIAGELDQQDLIGKGRDDDNKSSVRQRHCKSRGVTTVDPPISTYGRWSLTRA